MANSVFAFGSMSILHHAKNKFSAGSKVMMISEKPSRSTSRSGSQKNVNISLLDNNDSRDIENANENQVESPAVSPILVSENIDNIENDVNLNKRSPLRDNLVNTPRKTPTVVIMNPPQTPKARIPNYIEVLHALNLKTQKNTPLLQRRGIRNLRVQRPTYINSLGELNSALVKPYSLDLSSRRSPKSSLVTIGESKDSIVKFKNIGNPCGCPIVLVWPHFITNRLWMTMTSIE